MKKIISLLLVITLCFTFLPLYSIYAYALEATTDMYVIDNGYIEVVQKKDGSSFGINTKEGHPEKRFDNNQPLLYDGNDQFATSYTTVRIIKNLGEADEQVNDYVYGSSMGDIVSAPVITNIDNINKSIRTVWRVDGVCITQDMIITADTAGEAGGYVNIQYSYQNETTENIWVGIRVLLDTKIAGTDGGSFFKNGGDTPISRETTFTGEDVPDWYAISDRVYNSTTSAYGLLKNQKMRRTPDTVQMAHWYNLANTLWDYTTNSGLDFADYYNDYLMADSAISIMFDAELVTPNQLSSVDTLYGVGELNGTVSSSDYCVMKVTQKEELKVNAAKNGYENDGEVILYLTIDNSDKDSKQIVDGKLKIVFEDKILDNELNITQEPALWVASEKQEDEVISVGTIQTGEIKRNIPIKLKARPVYISQTDKNDKRYSPAAGYELYTGIDTRKIKLELTGDFNPIPSIASKVVTLPALGNAMPDIAFTGIDPKIIYYEGYSYFNVKGIGANFRALADKSNWSAYLRNVVTNEIINLDSFDCAVDTINSQLGLLVDLKKKIGEFELTIEFRNNLASMPKKVFSNQSDHIISSDDAKYKNRGYSIATIARTSNGINNDMGYEMRLFTAEPGATVEMQFDEYKRKIEGTGGEMLLEGRGVFKVLYRGEYNVDTDSSNKGLVISTDSNISNPNIMGFETIPGSDNIKLNRILYYNAMTPLTFKAEFDNNGKPNTMEVTGDGDLSIINASTIWKDKFQIKLPLGGRYSYDPADIGNSEKPKLQLLGAGWLVQNLGHLLCDLNYGELGCEDGRYTIEFSGQISFPLGMNKSDDDEEKTPGTTGTGDAPPAAKKDTGNGTGTNKDTDINSFTGAGNDVGSALNEGIDTDEESEGNIFKDGNTVTNALGAFTDGGSLGLSVDSILFGEHEDKENPENIKTGFVGVAVNVQLELPDSVFPAGGKQSNNETVTKGTTAANPTSADSTIVGTASGKATTVGGQLQNATAAKSKKKASMSAFSIGAGLNTYDFYAGVDLGIGIGPLNTGFRMSLAEMNNGKICLDSIYFEIKGFTVPIVPNILNWMGAGGGISDLASSINYQGDARPPVTVSLMAAFDIVYAMALQGDFSVSGNGISFAISGYPKGYDKIKFIAAGEMDWTTGFTMRLSGTIDLFSGVVLGNVVLGLTTTPKVFLMGKITGTLNVPAIGTLAGVSLVLTSEYIAGGARIAIFGGGFVYYYSSDNYRILGVESVDELEAVDVSEPDEMFPKSIADAGNQAKLAGDDSARFLEVMEVKDEKTGEVRYMGIGLGAQVVGTSMPNSITSNGLAGSAKSYVDSFETGITNEMIQGNEAVFKIYYDGDTAPELHVTKPDGTAYNTVEYDFNKTQEENNLAGANMLKSEKENNKTGKTDKYVYITVFDNELQSGNWKVESANDVKISNYTLMTVPTITPKLEINSASVNGSELQTSWTADDKANVTVSMVPCDDNGNVIMESFVAPDGQTITNEHPGYIIGNGTGSGNTTFPLQIPSGKYVVRMDTILNTTMFTTKYTDTALVYSNPNTLAQPTFNAYAGGDGRINITSDVPQNATGVNFTVYRKLADGEKELVKGMGGYVGDFEGKGNISTYFKGQITQKDSEGNAVLTSSITPGDTYIVEACAVNVNEGSGYFKSPVVQSSEIYVPVPKPPKVDIKLNAGDAVNKLTESGVSYVQINDPNILVEYDITNMDEVPNDEVTVRFDIDEKQYGEVLTNNAEKGSKGYAAFNITDGEHFVDIIFTNKAGDVTVETRKLSLDSIPADIKINSPLSGSTFDPDTGIEIDLVTDDSVTIDVYLDDILCIDDDKIENSDGIYKKTITVSNSNYSHNMKIIATDKNGNKTEYLATVVNKAVTDIGEIEIKSITPTGTDAVELYAVALNSEGEETGLELPKDMLVWTLLSDPAYASMSSTRGNKNVIVSPSDNTGFSVSAEWKLTDTYSFKDVYDSGIVGEKTEGTEDGTSTSSGHSPIKINSTGNLSQAVRDIINKIKANMAGTAEINAYKMYSAINSTSKQSDNVVFIKGSDIDKENYLVLGTDSSAKEYSLNEGYKFASDIVEFYTQDPVKPILLDIAVTSDGLTDNMGIYRYVDKLGKWLYVGGAYDGGRKMMSVSVNTGGRYAVIENPDFQSLDFEDIESNWAKTYIRSMSYAQLINGYLENDIRLFKPQNEITRGEFIKMLVSATGLQTNNTAVSMFADSDTFETWQIPYVAAASEIGWLKGSEVNGLLMANLSDNITRQDAMVLIYRAFFGDKKAEKSTGFADENIIAEYAKDAIEYMSELGIVAGYEDNTIKPVDYVLREETAKLLLHCIMN